MCADIAALIAQIFRLAANSGPRYLDFIGSSFHWFPLGMITVRYSIVKDNNADLGVIFKTKTKFFFAYFAIFLYFLEKIKRYHFSYFEYF